MIRFLFLLFFSIEAYSASFSMTANLQKHVSYLASDGLEGRLTGSVGEKQAAEYIKQQFQQIGLTPAGDNRTFLEKIIVPKHPSNIKAYNVLAKLIVDPDTKQLIVVSAHLDHLGRGQDGGSRSGSNKIHPGADDDASGVASVIELARQLHALALRGNKNILFAVWTGEEIGVLGSSYFIKNFKHQFPTEKIVAVVNLDMIGHLRSKLVIQGVGSSDDWPQLIKKSMLNPTLKIIMQKDPYLPTDSTTFYIRQIPSLNLFTGAHDFYHTPRDTAGTLNYKGIKLISEYVIALLGNIEMQSTIHYQAIAKPKNEGGILKNYLGTIPDYASTNIKGVKLAGVAKKSPAAIAGIRANDVVIKLAGKSIRDIYDYMAAINNLQIGEPTEILVVRHKQEKIKLSVLAVSR